MGFNSGFKGLMKKALNLDRYLQFSVLVLMGTIGVSNNDFSTPR